MDRISSIKLAIKNESIEMEYYLNEARRSRNSIARSLFETLAADEKEHMIQLRQLHEKLLEDGSWPEQVPIQVGDTNIKSVLKNIERNKEITEEHDLDDIQALKKGIAFEADGAKFYAELADACDNRQEKKFFSFLSKIEREHMLSMQDSLFYLEDPDGWFESNARVSMDGA